jgi:hypothetical protein
LKDQQDNALVSVPDLAQFGIEEEEAREWDGINKDRIDALLAMAGQSVRVRNEFPSGKTIVHYEEFLPADLAPMLILDASGEQRTTYRYWREHRGGLKFLYSPQKSYEGLTIHHRDTGSGRTAHKAGRGDRLATGIAKTINSSVPEDEEVLVIHFKPGKPPRKGRKPAKKVGLIPDLETEIKDQLNHNPDRVKFCNWGRHTATNDYCHIKYVFLCGVLQYNLAQYDATLRLSKGLKAADEIDNASIGKFAWARSQTISCRLPIEAVSGHLWAIAALPGATYM